MTETFCVLFRVITLATYVEVKAIRLILKFY